jgi:hypothetical protein
MRSRGRVANSRGLNLKALVAVVGLCAAAGLSVPIQQYVDPLADHTSIGQVEPGSFTSQHGTYFSTVDDNNSYLAQMFERVPASPSDVATMPDGLGFRRTLPVAIG